MSTEDVSIGEGFAFFRWHSLRWQYCCTCKRALAPYCYNDWANHER
jgi:hypothetical protein